MHVTVMYATRDEVQAELTDYCAQAGITVNTVEPAVFYATAADPRKALEGLLGLLAGSMYRQRSVARGSEESFVTVLDAIDLPTTIKIRRPLGR